MATEVSPNPLPDIPIGDLTVRLVPFAEPPKSAAVSPVARFNTLYHADDGSGRLFVNDTRGPIWLIEADGTVDPQPFLDLSAVRGSKLLTAESEQGVRSFAFHPDYENPGTSGYGKFYTISTEVKDGAEVPALSKGIPAADIIFHDVIAEWQVDADDPTRIDVDSRREVLRLGEWRAGHNADQIMFNPNVNDGLLYISTGDGGNNRFNFDPYDQGQDLGAPLGKILRINPLESNGQPYTVPTNPFANVSGALDEIWAYGLRHPQNVSFDIGGTGKMLISDIGQKWIEEINLGIAGANYGWVEREGTFVPLRNDQNELYALPDNDAQFGYTYPVAQYDHADPSLTLDGGRTAAVTGGYVYRGSKVPELVGHYLFGDIPNGTIFHVPVNTLVNGSQARFEVLKLEIGDQQITLLDFLNTSRADLRFGQGEDGEVYVMSKQNGVIYSLAPATGAPPGGGGGTGTPTTVATSGNDYLVFGSGNDVINALAGNDTIDSGGGQDTIAGGSGADIFILRANQPRDLINDFSPGSDLIQLDGLTLDQIELKPTSGGTNIKQGTLVLASVKGVTLTASDFATGGGGGGGGASEDSTPISIGALDAAKNEGNSGTTAFTFTVGRPTGPLTPADSVTWTVTGIGGAPANAADFAGPLTGTISFGPAVDAQTLTILVTGDTNLEADETFRVTLSSPALGTIGTGTASGTILNDDAPPSGGGGGTGAPTTVATNGDDYLVFGSGNDVIKALAGNDTIDSGGGQDTVTGGTGADVFILRADQPRDVINDFAPGSDLIQLEGLALDEIELKPTSGGTNIKQGALTLASVKGVTLSLSDLTTDGTGTGGGTGGGGTGGGTGTPTTVATDGDDYLVFGSGNDVIKALAGNDTIDSGGGQDTVTGGLGDDRFLLRAGQPRDVINDFVRGSDLIQLDGLGLDDIELKPTSGGTNIKQGALTLASVKGVTLSMADIADASPTTTLLALDGEDMQQLLL